MTQISLQPSSSDFELLVDYYLQPYEPPETGPEARYPGCPASISIEHVTLNGHDITSLLSERQLQSIEEDIWIELKALAFDPPY